MQTTGHLEMINQSHLGCVVAPPILFALACSNCSVLLELSLQLSAIYKPLLGIKTIKMVAHSLRYIMVNPQGGKYFLWSLV